MLCVGRFGTFGFTVGIIGGLGVRVLGIRCLGLGIVL